MKKIISALALSAVAATIATAEMKVSLNYRNGMEVFKLVNKGMDGRTVDDYGNQYDDSGYDNNGTTKTLFNLTGWNSGKDNVTLQASGDVFALKATLQPAIASDNIIWHIFDATANFGNLKLEAGWNGDGVGMNFRVKKAADDGNEEGKVFETFKPGSIFTGSVGLCSTNQVSFNTGRNLFSLASYNLALDAFSLRATGALIFDRTWDSSAETQNGNLGWSIFLDPKIPNVLDAEVFIKAVKVGAAGTDKYSQIVTGAYFKPSVLSDLKISDSGIGASFVFLTGDEDEGQCHGLQEFNFDWRIQAKPSDALMITYMGKFAKLVANADKTPYDEVDGASVGALAGLTAFKSSQALWNMVSARYKVSDLLTGVLTVGQLSDLDDGFQFGRESADGTQIYVHPHVQIYASKGASITAGVLAAFGGIGANEEANKDVDVLINIPVLFRVKM